MSQQILRLAMVGICSEALDLLPKMLAEPGFQVVRVLSPDPEDLSLRLSRLFGLEVGTKVGTLMSDSPEVVVVGSRVPEEWKKILELGTWRIMPEKEILEEQGWDGLGQLRDEINALDTEIAESILDTSSRTASPAVSEMAPEAIPAIERPEPIPEPIREQITESIPEPMPERIQHMSIPQPLPDWLSHALDPIRLAHEIARDLALRSQVSALSLRWRLGPDTILEGAWMPNGWDIDQGHLWKVDGGPGSGRLRHEIDGFIVEVSWVGDGIEKGWDELYPILRQAGYIASWKYFWNRARTIVQSAEPYHPDETV